MALRRAASISLAAAVLTSLLIVPSGGASATAVAARFPAHGLVTDALPLPAGAAVASLPAGAELRIGLTLPYDHASDLGALLARLGDPASPGYRQFLTYPEFEADFGPPGASVAAVRSVLSSAGATSIEMPAGSTTVEATVSPAAFADLFGATPVVFETPGGAVGFTTVGPVRLPAGLTGIVTGLEGLSGPVERQAARTAFPLTLAHVAPVGRGGPLFVQDEASGYEWFVGSDFTQAYEAVPLLPGSSSSLPHATFPSGIAIATLLASAYNTTTFSTLPPFDPSVVDRYFADTLAPGWPVPNLTGVPVPEPGASTPPLPGSFGTAVDSLGMETENSLDLEMAGSLAPGAPLYNFYFSGSLVANPSVTFGSLAGYFADDLAAALAHNYGTAHLAVVSCSFGLPDLNNSAWDTELTLAAALGVTVVAASGDQGNSLNSASALTVGPGPLWPATAAFNTSGAVSVGGVSITLSGTATANYTGPPLVAAYDDKVQGIAAGMRAWYDTTGGRGAYAGTEGGVSGVFAEPWWQFHSAAQPSIVTAAQNQGAQTLGRSGPDLAFPANDTIAYIAAQSGTPIFGLVSGTSIAAPVLAGLLADVVGVESATRGHFSPLGFLTPELYRLASYFAANPGSADPFYDVTNGSNALFAALPGWDATTGWGGLLAPQFLAADGNPAEANYTYTGPTPTLPPNPNPSISVLTGAVVLGGAATAAIVAVVIVLYRRETPAPPPDAFDAYLLPAGPGGAPPAPEAPTATFPCPYCGIERPAEAGPCPGCGVR